MKISTRLLVVLFACLLAGCAAPRAAGDGDARPAAGETPAPGPDRHALYPPWGTPSGTVSRPYRIEQVQKAVGGVLEKFVWGGKPQPAAGVQKEEGAEPEPNDPYRRWSTGGEGTD